MQPDDTYRTLAEKFLHTTKYPEILVPDSLLKVLRHMYTEEEAAVVLQMRDGLQPAGAIARKLRRPVAEVKPLLESLARRVLILGLGSKGISLYGRLPIYPIVYDAQMLLSDKKMREGDSGAWFKEFARLFNDFLEEFYLWLAPREVASKYQVVGLPFGRIIAVEQAVEASPGLGILAFPSDRYSELVERAKKSLCLVNVCACRQGMALLGKGCGRLQNTCSAMGLPAEGAIKAGMGRRVSKEEFLEAKLQATEAGLVHMTENVLDPILVCSCCTCCCEILRILNKFNSPGSLTQSRFEAVVDPHRCTGCGACAKMCPMAAIALVEDRVAATQGAALRQEPAPKKRSKKKTTAGKRAAGRKKASINYSRCIGCGVCVTQCDKSRAITLRERKIYQPPADNMVEFWMRRHFELKERQDHLLPRLSLGVTRFLSQLNPVHVTGPRAPSFRNYKP